ncbi:hypothetical protein ACS8Y6_04390 [Salinisphaera sp. RV14]|uniref:hypothetical protein n=1 Tax=Salinisphaera sp. RV14 TaxID=3454140 RepID=UPI003F867827
MSKLSSEVSAELVASFYKAAISLVLATAGGQLALIETVFSDSNCSLLAYVSLILVLLSGIFDLGAYETMVNRLSKTDSPKCSLAENLEKFSPKSEGVEIALRHVSGILYGSGIVCFAAFAYLS